MAARAWKPGDQCLFKQGKVVRGVLTISGASGAVGSWVGYGVNSVTKESTAGQYTFVLNNAHKRLMGAEVVGLLGTAEDITFQLISENVDDPTLASRTIVLQAKAGSSAADLGDGAKVYASFFLTDSELSTGNTL